MQLKDLTKRWPEFAGAIPLLATLPWSWHAWRHSRLDAGDWIFYLFFLVALDYAWKRLPIPQSKHRSLFPAICTTLALLAMGTGIHTQTRALTIVGTQVFWWAMFCWTGGWMHAQTVLPAFLLLTLGIPGTSYWMGSLLGIGTTWGMSLKIVLSLVAGAWLFANLRWHLIMRLQTVLFVTLWSILLIFLVHSHRITITGNSFLPDFPTQRGTIWGRAVPPTENDLRFFATSTIRKFHYFTPDNQDFNILEVTSGMDLHEMHPASICLQTSRWQLETERIISPWKNFYVTEIIARKGQTKILIWVWYSNHQHSTASFLGFRRLYRHDETWKFYQVSTTIANQNTRSCRDRMRQLLNDLKEEN